MHYAKYGHGVDRVFLGIHGWGGGHRTFDPLLPYLPYETSLVAVDLPGYGDSPDPRAWRIDAIADELVEVIDEIEARELTLIGNCSGAIYGLAAVTRRPQAFSRLVLLDVFAYFPWYFDMLLWPGLGRFFYRVSFHNPLGQWLTNVGLRRHRTEETHLTESFASLQPDVVYEYLRMMAQLPGPEVFTDLDMPIDLVHGEKTFDAVRRSINIWKEVWPQAQVHELKEAAHLPIQEATAQLAGVVWKGEHHLGEEEIQIGPSLNFSTV